MSNHDPEPDEPEFHNEVESSGYEISEDGENPHPFEYYNDDRAGPPLVMINSNAPSQEQQSQCVICMEPLTQGISVLAQCGHVGHSICLIEHIDAQTTRGTAGTCPICRAEILQGELVELHGYHSGGAPQDARLINHAPRMMPLLPERKSKVEQRIRALAEENDELQTEIEEVNQIMHALTWKLKEAKEWKDNHMVECEAKQCADRLAVDVAKAENAKLHKQLVKCEGQLATLRSELRRYRAAEVSGQLNEFIKTADYETTLKKYENRSDPDSLMAIITTLREANVKLQANVKEAVLKGEANVQKARGIDAMVAIDLKGEITKLKHELAACKEELYESQRVLAREDRHREKKRPALSSSVETGIPILRSKEKRIRTEVVPLAAAAPSIPSTRSLNDVLISQRDMKSESFDDARIKERASAFHIYRQGIRAYIPKLGGGG